MAFTANTASPDTLATHLGPHRGRLIRRRHIAEHRHRLLILEYRYFRHSHYNRKVTINGQCMAGEVARARSSCDNCTMAREKRKTVRSGWKVKRTEPNPACLIKRLQARSRRIYKKSGHA